MLYLRARYYSPALGVFPSLDPLEDGNRYAWVQGNVINRIDPSGLIDERPEQWNKCMDFTPCDELEDIIRQIVDELVTRVEEQLNNFCKLWELENIPDYQVVPPQPECTGAGTWSGHNDQIYSVQGTLSTNLRKFDADFMPCPDPQPGGFKAAAKQWLRRNFNAKTLKPRSQGPSSVPQPLPPKMLTYTHPEPPPPYAEGATP